MSSQHVLAACTHSMSSHHVLATCPCNMSAKHFPTAFSHSMYSQHVLTAWPSDCFVLALIICICCGLSAVGGWLIDVGCWLMAGAVFWSFLFDLGNFRDTFFVVWVCSGVIFGVQKLILEAWQGLRGGLGALWAPVEHQDGPR